MKNPAEFSTNRCVNTKFDINGTHSKSTNSVKYVPQNSEIQKVQYFFLA